MERIVDPKEDRRIAESYKNIPGWGIDADPNNKPNYPIKHYTGADHERSNYEKPPQQDENIEVLKSNERPQLSAVFGTSTPPSGVSGMIRRFAFKYSESSYGHWVPLVMADRIDVVQGIISDIRHGIFPNIFAEKGWQAEWKYNRNGLIKKFAVTVLVATVAIAFLSRKKKQSLFN